MNLAQIEADVCQSQAIEHIRYDATSPLTMAHIEAASCVLDEVAQQRWPNVRAIHSVLMKPSHLDIPEIGAWRTWGVYTKRDNKKRHMPAAFHVPQLMLNWESECATILWHYRAGTLDPNELDALADVVYNDFLCIHPFTDGNGRTGRLMRNAMRLLLGLPWMTITVDSHPLYVRKLIAYEDDYFRPCNKSMYESLPE